MGKPIRVRVPGRPPFHPHRLSAIVQHGAPGAGVFIAVRSLRVFPSHMARLAVQAVAMTSRVA